MAKAISKRFRKFTRKAKNHCGFNKIKKEIKKAQKETNGITDYKITSLLKCSDSFLGCYAENELSFTISFPLYFIVNTDRSDMAGSHWLAIGIFKDNVEIFDPLGFDIFNWSRVPSHLLNFLHRLSVSRKITVLKRVQSDSSTLCGFYAIFYVLFRPLNSFKTLEKLFDSDLDKNDYSLINLFS